MYSEEQEISAKLTVEHTGATGGMLLPAWMHSLKFNANWAVIETAEAGLIPIFEELEKKKYDGIFNSTKPQNPKRSSKENNSRFGFMSVFGFASHKKESNENLNSTNLPHEQHIERLRIIRQLKLAYLRLLFDQTASGTIIDELSEQDIEQQLETLAQKRRYDQNIQLLRNVLHSEIGDEHKWFKIIQLQLSFITLTHSNLFQPQNVVSFSETILNSITLDHQKSLSSIQYDIDNIKMLASPYMIKAAGKTVEEILGKSVELFKLHANFDCRAEAQLQNLPYTDEKGAIIPRRLIIENWLHGQKKINIPLEEIHCQLQKISRGHTSYSHAGAILVTGRNSPSIDATFICKTTIKQVMTHIIDMKFEDLLQYVQKPMFDIRAERWFQIVETSDHYKQYLLGNKPK
eukprot:Pgem_evm2s13021